MSRELIVSPSLLSSDFGRLANELTALEEGGLKWVHWDVMDGNFVPNITVGAPVIKCARKFTEMFFDVHLMVDKPERYVDDFVDAGADLLVVHEEASTHLERTISQIKQKGIQAGVALNPHTPLCNIEYLLPELDLVLIMSVNPGFGGQTFLPFCLDKIATLKEMLVNAESQAKIQVDGGVTPENVAKIFEAGTDVIVTGSAFFNFPPYGKRRELFETVATMHLGQEGF